MSIQSLGYLLSRESLIFFSFFFSYEFRAVLTPSASTRATHLCDVIIGRDVTLSLFGVSPDLITGRL